MRAIVGFVFEGGIVLSVIIGYSQEEKINLNMENERPKTIEDVGLGFYVDSKKVWKLEVPITRMDVRELLWHFEIPFWEKSDTDDFNLTPNEVIARKKGTQKHRERIEKADTSHPIDIMRNKGRWLILDGLHRLVKLYESGAEMVDVRIIPREKIPEILKKGE